MISLLHPDHVQYECLVLACNSQLVCCIWGSHTVPPVAFLWPYVLFFLAVPLVWLRRSQNLNHWQHSSNSSVLQHTHTSGFLCGWTLTQNRYLSIHCSCWQLRGGSHMVSHHDHKLACGPVQCLHCRYCYIYKNKNIKTLKTNDCW